MDDKNPFAALLRDVPRLATETTVDGEQIIVCNDGPFVRYDRVLAALAAAVPADLAEAGKVLEKTVNTCIDLSDQNMGVEARAVGSAADTIRSLLARIAAMEAQIKGLEAERDHFELERHKHQRRAMAAETALATLRALKQEAGE